MKTIFALFRQDPDRPRKTLEELEAECLNSVKEYHLEYGRQGFLSEKTNIEDVPRIARQLAEEKLAFQDVDIVVDTFTVQDDDVESKRAEIAAMPFFHGWPPKGPDDV